MKKLCIEEMSWLEYKQAMASNDLVIVPVGSMEEHGPHNPLGTDYMIAEQDAKAIAERTGGIVAPTMIIGNARNLMGFPGTCNIGDDLLIELTCDVAENLIRHGAKRLFFVNGHGGNAAPLRMACDIIYAKHGTLCVVTEWWVILKQISEHSCADHGGQYETSYLMASCGEGCGINMSIAKTVDRKNPSPNISFGHGLTFRDVPINLSFSMERVTPLGNYGCPAEKANLALGQDMRRIYLDYAVSLVEDMKKVQL